MEIAVDREFEIEQHPARVKVSLVFSNGCRAIRYEPARNYNHAVEKMHAMMGESLLDTICRVGRHK